MRSSQALALLSSIAVTHADFLAPADGQNLQVDQAFNVRWETDGLVEPININIVPVGNENAAQEVAAGVDNSGSASFTPDASLTQFDQLELVLTDSDDNTVTSNAFSIAGGDAASQGASNQQGGNGRVSAAGEGGRQRQSANDEEGDQSESDLQVPGGVSRQGAGRVSAAVEPQAGAQAEDGAGARGGNNNNSNNNNNNNQASAAAGNNLAGPPGSFIPADPAALTITPTIAGTPAVLITDPAQIATAGVNPNVGVINGQQSNAAQATADVNIQTVPVQSAAAGIGAGIANPVQLSPVATPSAAVIDPASLATQASLSVDGGLAQTGALALTPIASGAAGVQAGFSTINAGVAPVASVAASGLASGLASGVAAVPTDATVSAEVIGGAAGGLVTPVVGGASTAIAGAVSLDPLASAATGVVDAGVVGNSVAPIATPGVLPSVGASVPGVVAPGNLVTPTIVPNGQFTDTGITVPTGSIPEPINPSNLASGVSSFATNVINSAGGLGSSALSGISGITAAATGAGAQNTAAATAAAPGLSVRGALVGGVAALVALWVM